MVADIAQALGYDDIAFIDQAWPSRLHNGIWPILGAVPDGEPEFCAVGNNAVRARLWHAQMPVLVHPSAILSPTASLGAGTLVAPGAVVNADASIGRGVILNTGCSIDHDCILGDFVHVSPGARLAGNVHVGDGTWIGIGAVVREGLHIGKNVIVAAGAAVIHNLSDNARVGGVPARAI